MSETKTIGDGGVAGTLGDGGVTATLPKLVLFRAHQGDPLCKVIQEVTWTDYTHAAILTDPATNEISEAYVPHVRRRRLNDSELAGIAIFDIAGMTPAAAALVLAHCAAAEAAAEPYSIENLFRFNPIFRAILGQPTDTSIHTPLICSQYAFDAFAAGGLRLLNAPSYKLAPGYLAWSPLALPAPDLKPLGKS